MATFSLEKDPLGGVILSWAGVAASETGTSVPVNGPRQLAGAVQMLGTFGGTVTLEQSIDGTTFYPVADLQGVDIALTAAGLKQFSTASRYLRVSSGVGVSAVTVLVALRG